MEIPACTSPIRLRPLYMERVWGGRMIASLYQRELPGSAPIGESWEVVDREGEQSVVEGGEFAGKTLHDLWQNHRAEIFGTAAPEAERFPLLIKILDARDKLSIQVHPPADVAPRLGGEPKTEMWYIARADHDAALYVGVQPGVDRTAFAAALEDGTVADAVHRLPAHDGDFIFVPSGRLHAIGAGLVIFEIQQNSDTTYRVFDWKRPGLDGKPRALHVQESLECIDFTDTAPAMGQEENGVLVACPYFRVERKSLPPGTEMIWGREGEFSVLTVVEGTVEWGGAKWSAGDFVLIPACLPAESRHLRAFGDALLLCTRFGA